MKLPGMLVAGLVLAHSAQAGVSAFDYRLGATNVSEDQYQIVIHAQPAVTVAILPGGRPWPALSLDEAGRIYAGGTVIDSGAVADYLIERIDIARCQVEARHRWAGCRLSCRRSACAA
ncbi:hypothetical protein [Duganella vulcania]|uniref:Uncharacterized protein n=1 Tax=Duganella vulcania TaxID=2692166 RepID=A0A845GT10_9BURK|nr:hypothetical protein [Duganella vulcania]MYM97161.1 hypothetical protein [Duganella vulcania]